MAIFTAQDFQSFSSKQRRNLLNKISGIRPVCLIGTANEDGNTNLTVFNSLVHIGANPPLLGLILRPTTVERHTYENIKKTGVYSINLSTVAMLDASHQSSAKYPKDISEFDATGLEAEWLDGFQAPFVKESPIKIGLSLEEEHFIQANETRLLVGRVEQLIIPENSIDSNDQLLVEHLDLLNVAGLDTYFQTEFLKRKDYARP